MDKSDRVYEVAIAAMILVSAIIAVVASSISDIKAASRSEHASFYVEPR